MRQHPIPFIVIIIIGLSCLFILSSAARAESLRDQNDILFRQLQTVHGLSDEQMRAIRKIFSDSGFIGQGNPAITRHPVSPQECREKLEKRGVHYENGEFEKICGAKYMAPLYNPATQKAEEATACIDQFEFPDIPCAYPVVWVRAREAADMPDHGQTDLRRPRMGRSLRRRPRTAGLPVRPGERCLPGYSSRKNAAGPQRGLQHEEDLGLWHPLREGDLRSGEHEIPGCNGEAQHADQTSIFSGSFRTAIVLCWSMISMGTRRNT